MGLSSHSHLTVDDALTFGLRPGILITWSSESIDEAIQASLLQVYSALLSTFLSINRKQLSLYNANLALNITSSPLTVYLIFSSICYLFRIENGLYKRIKIHPCIISVLGTLIPGLWLALSMTLELSSSAFIDSELCKDSTFKGWLISTLLFMRSALIGSGWTALGLLPFIGTAWLAISFREWPGVIAGVRPHLDEKSKPWVWFCAPWVFMKSSAKPIGRCDAVTGVKFSPSSVVLSRRERLLCSCGTVAL